MIFESILNNSLFLIPALTGFIFILIGFFMYKFPPEMINALYGYRTKNSMKNQERWDFSQIYAAKQMIMLGFFLTLNSLIGVFYFPEEDIGMSIGFTLLFVGIIIMIIRVERAIKRKFN